MFLETFRRHLGDAAKTHTSVATAIFDIYRNGCDYVIYLLGPEKSEPPGSAFPLLPTRWLLLLIIFLHKNNYQFTLQ